MHNDPSSRMRPKALFGVIGAGVGAGVGGWYAARTGAYVYAGIGAAIGVIAGSLLGIVVKRHLSPGRATSIEIPLFVVIGVMAAALAVAGIVGFLRTGKWMGVVGAVVFALAAVYSFRRARS